MSADIYVYHSGQPGAPQLTAAGAAGQLEAILYAIGVTGFGGGVLDSLTQTGGIATATRSGGLNLADGLAGMPHIVKISGSTNGWDGEYQLNAAPGSTSCTFAVPSGLPSPATGTMTLVRAPCGLSRIATASNKSVWQFKDTSTFPGYLMLDDSSAQLAGTRLAETAAAPPDYSSMTGLCPTVAQQSGIGLFVRKSDGSGTANKNWIAIIDKGCMYLFVEAYTSYAGLYEPYFFGAGLSLKSGDLYPGMIIARTQNSTSPDSRFLEKNATSIQYGQFLQRGYAQTGSAVTFSKVGLHGSSLYIGYSADNNGNGNYVGDPNPVDNAIHVNGPLYVFEQISSGVQYTPLRGYMPGLYDPLNAGYKVTFDLLTNLVNLPGRTLLLIRAVNGSSYKGRIALDITGPWRQS